MVSTTGAVTCSLHPTLIPGHKGWGQADFSRDCEEGLGQLGMGSNLAGTSPPFFL